MADNSDNLLKLIHDTKALSIWDRKKGPVFWYILGVPGPFYFNIELMIGKAASEDLLQKITAILTDTDDLAARAQQLNRVVMAAYESNPAYTQIVSAMAASARKQFGTGTYDFISGGERRDWFFSIPLAKELGIPHIFLFKDQRVFCDKPLTPGQFVLHVADLINNAASYFEKWLPALKNAQLACRGTVCVVSRGPGATKLEESGIEVAPLVNIDLSFFERSFANGLISQETLTEIACHFKLPKEWAEKYLFDNPAVFDVAHVDNKSFERLQSFFTQDPWSLRERHAAFFDSIRQAIAARLRSAA